MDHQIKGEKNKLILKRLHVLWHITIILFSLLILKVSWIQLGMGEKYSHLAIKNNFKEIPILAPRGKIYERNGKLLVSNKSLYSLIYLEPISTKGEKLKTARELAKTLRIPLLEILHLMDAGFNQDGDVIPRRSPPYTPKKIKVALTDEEVVRITENPSLFPGVNIYIEPIRMYRGDTFAVQTIGYVRPYSGAKVLLKKYKVSRNRGYVDWEQVGMDGLELSYQDDLRGTNGYRLVQVNSSGKIVKVLKEVTPKAGKDIYLTLDEKMQLSTEKFIQTLLNKLRLKNAYAVAIEVPTGKVRTMVSYPDYDPGIWNNQISKEDYQTLSYVIQNGTIQEAPWDNRDISPNETVIKHAFSLVPPGSVMKPFTTLIGLHKGLITATSKWRDTGRFTYAKSTPPVKNAGNRSYGYISPEQAIQKSSNTFMAWIGTNWYKKDKEKAISELSQFSHLFGLGTSTGINLYGEQKGIEDYVLISKKYSGLGAMVLASFGQAQRYTTIQLAQYTATLASKGIRRCPQLIEKIVDTNSKQITQMQPRILNRVLVNPLYFSIVERGMVKVTQSGGTAAHLFDELPYEVAAKTGTSQQEIQGRGRIENSIFIAYAPANNPKIAVAVVVPEGGSGVKVAGLIAKHIITLYHEQFIKK